MASEGKLLFDLNELPTDDDYGIDHVNCDPPPQQQSIPSAKPETSGFVATPLGSQDNVSNRVFSHASTVSGFQPFVRGIAAHHTDVAVERKVNEDSVKGSLSSTFEEAKVASSIVLNDAGASEREEGEWTESEVPASDNVHSSSSDYKGTSVSSDYSKVTEKDNGSVVLDSNSNSGLLKRNVNHISESSAKDSASIDSPQEQSLTVRQREIKGVEASHAIKCANTTVKRKMDQQKETMLGKKRNRQTMFLNLEDVKQAGPIKTTTPRRQNFPQPVVTRTVRESRAGPPPAEQGGGIPGHVVYRDQKPTDIPNGGIHPETSEQKLESNGESHSGSLGKTRRMNGEAGPSAEGTLTSMSRQGSWKQPMNSRQLKTGHSSNRQVSLGSQSSVDSKFSNKKFTSFKKPVTNSSQYQDTSVERLIREVTNEKFWHHPEDTDLQCVPERFESMDDYVRVFEPLLFEECRAQLYSTWEELAEANSYMKVRIKAIERRERGWYDVILLSVNECKWAFKEGDVAVLSNPMPESEGEHEDAGRVAGTVRRYIPVDTRDPHGAILHFYVGDTYDSGSKIDDNHILRKLKPKEIWHLTVLGSLATSQREYVALHAFSQLNPQMQNAILRPSPEQFPNYGEQTPTVPDCFTPSFASHLHRSFNAPQLAAIHWAAMHTAAGTSSGVKRQDPWPFTLVQGPPGTGKTHTVWGMLNVIHLVQYQQYYTSLLKKLAPESYKQGNESGSDNIVSGSIDEVLQNMDQNLFRTLPKLCAKPRMLVCAPSNAATDELLSRVLDRGFIDGEMRVYRPDVARVGVDTQTRAAQAVSVERRSEQLLAKSRDEILGHMHNLRLREAQLSLDIAGLKRELTAAAFANRSQGSVGVDPDVLMVRDQTRDAMLQRLSAVVEARDKDLVEMSRLLIVEGKFRAGNNFNLEEARASLEASFANEAEIVFTTVSSSGRKLFSRLTHGFDMVVIDEAAQASEVGVLPPLALGAARCVLVGDPQQLPATVISKAAGTLLYSRSLFERFQLAGCPTLLLTVQYRMHPQIRDFPSRYFYQGRLTDSESVSTAPDEIYYKDSVLKPYLFFDISHGRESHRGGSVSYENIDEARFCVGLYMHLQRTLKSLGGDKVSVGVITPYKLQLKCLKIEFGNALGQDELKEIYINTVDAFQGQERDVIIMSCVRASGHGVGFVSDIRRMNVALTRAKRALWVMGNASALMKSEDWAALITDARARNCFMEMESLPKDFPVPKVPSFIPKAPNGRGFRSGGPRTRSIDMHPESRSGTPSEDDEKLSITTTFSRNGNSRRENSIDDSDPPGDRYRDAWQHGIQRRQNFGRPLGRRD
ncbi:putative helicase MAGATAMA 3 [Cardamine amara subsp. amara]|uniref:Helicase MAGATAMA 3 n=1 Tax=Cardamine amara subsp. amara TaxID=228776 RepID=A0ABD1AVI5_CARAN